MSSSSRKPRPGEVVEKDKDDKVLRVMSEEEFEFERRLAVPSRVRKILRGQGL